MKILITEFMDEAAVSMLQERFDVTYAPDLADRQTDIPGLMSGVRGLIVRNRTQVTTELLDAGGDVECVGRLGVGLDNIDLEACAARDVTVYPATGANNLSVAEYVITNAMMLLRGAYFSGDAMRAGLWPRQACAGREIAGKSLGLVGYGAIAQQTAAMARALGMTIAAFDPFVPADHPAWAETQRCDLPALLAVSDVLSIHTPLTDETRHLIDATAMAAMKPGAVVINAARGGVLDDSAFAASVRAGHLGGGALDVFEIEPLTADAGEIFAGLDNVVLTPHIGGVTEESNERVSKMIANAVAAHLAG